MFRKITAYYVFQIQTQHLQIYVSMMKNSVLRYISKTDPFHI